MTNTEAIQTLRWSMKHFIWADKVQYDKALAALDSLADPVMTRDEAMIRIYNIAVEIACLGNGNRYGNSEGNSLAIDIIQFIDSLDVIAPKAVEPSEKQCLTCGRQCPNDCPMDKPSEDVKILVDRLNEIIWHDAEFDEDLNEAFLRVGIDKPKAIALITARDEQIRREEAKRIIDKLYDVRGEPDKLNSILMHERAAIMGGGRMPYKTRFYKMPVGEDGKRHRVWVNLNDYSMLSILARKEKSKEESNDQS